MHRRGCSGHPRPRFLLSGRCNLHPSPCSKLHLPRSELAPPCTEHDHSRPPQPQTRCHHPQATDPHRPARSGPTGPQFLLTRRRSMAAGKGKAGHHRGETLRPQASRRPTARYPRLLHRRQKRRHLAALTRPTRRRRGKAQTARRREIHGHRRPRYVIWGLQTHRNRPPSRRLRDASLWLRLATIHPRTRQGTRPLAQDEISQPPRQPRRPQHGRPRRPRLVPPPFRLGGSQGLHHRRHSARRVA